VVLRVRLVQARISHGLAGAGFSITKIVSQPKREANLRVNMKSVKFVDTLSPSLNQFTTASSIATSVG
jgi:hypothetical protein